MSDLDVMKNKLDGWREVSVMLYSVITWEQDWYPAVTAGCLTTVFLIISSTGPSIVTLLSIIGFLITMLDYLVPIITDKIFPRDQWNNNKDKKLETVARFLLNLSLMTSTMLTSYHQAKMSAPFYHFAVTTSTLMVTAFIGSLVSGMMLSYILLMLALMMPGLHSRGLLAQYCGSLVSFIEERMKGKKKE